MNLSKTAEYAIRILILLARHHNEVLSANTIHKELGIPYKYLTNLLRKLSELGFIFRFLGRQGGYILGEKLDDISVFQIICAIEGDKIFTKCFLGFEKCDENHPCPIHNEWTKVRVHLIQVLKKMTLSELKKIGFCRL